MSDNLGRGFVFVLVFLFTFPFILTIVPSEFIGSVDESEMSYYEDVPDNWVGDQIAGWDEEFSAYNNVTVEKDWVEHDFKVGEHDIEIMWAEWDAMEDPLYFVHEVKWGFFTVYHDFTESPVKKSVVMEGLEDYATPQTSRLVLNCQKTGAGAHSYTWYVSITYNETKFESLDEAYEGTVSYDPELRIFVGLGWNATIGSVNAWNVVGQLLTFQTPEVHPVINGLIGFSLWACIIYLAYRLILLAIPFVGG